MSFSYTCPNADCGVTLKTPNRVPPGKKVKCPKCGDQFVAEPVEAPPPSPSPAKPAGAGTFKFAEDESKKKPTESEKPPQPKKPHLDDDDEDPESVKKGYGVIKETEEEIAEAEKNKPKFKDAQEKFKKSARGPAISMLVMPTNLLVASGVLTAVGGLTIFVIGMWPLVFNDAPPGDEETEDAIVAMLLGLMAFGWGSMVCFGASQMSDLSSFTWAMMGAVLGILPLLVGVFALVTLLNPKVKAGFEESEGGPDDDDEDIEQKSDDDDETSDDDDDDHDDD